MEFITILNLGESGEGSNPPSVLCGIHLCVPPPSGPGQPIPVFGLAPGWGRFIKSQDNVIPVEIILVMGCVVSAPHLGLPPQLLHTWSRNEGGVSSARKSRQPLTYS